MSIFAGDSVRGPNSPGMVSMMNNTNGLSINTKSSKFEFTPDKTGVHSIATWQDLQNKQAEQIYTQNVENADPQKKVLRDPSVAEKFEIRNSKAAVKAKEAADKVKMQFEKMKQKHQESKMKSIAQNTSEPKEQFHRTMIVDQKDGKTNDYLIPGLIVALIVVVIGIVLLLRKCGSFSSKFNHEETINLPEISKDDTMFGGNSDINGISDKTFDDEEDLII